MEAPLPSEKPTLLLVMVEFETRIVALDVAKMPVLLFATTQFSRFNSVVPVDEDALKPKLLFPAATVLRTVTFELVLENIPVPLFSSRQLSICALIAPVVPTVTMPVAVPSNLGAADKECARSAKVDPKRDEITDDAVFNVQGGSRVEINAMLRALSVERNERQPAQVMVSLAPATTCMAEVLDDAVIPA
jgi:hypothetical protein